MNKINFSLPWKRNDVHFYDPEIVNGHLLQYFKEPTVDTIL